MEVSTCESSVFAPAVLTTDEISMFNGVPRALNLMSYVVRHLC